MFSEPADKAMDLGMTQIITKPTSGWLFQTVWLPRLVYDGLPYFYLTAGFAALFATLYVSDWFWVLPHYFLFILACLHMSFRIFRLRRDDGNDSPNNSESVADDHLVQD